MSKLNVLSLFNGMSFGMMALETLGVPVGNYYSSEIDKYANQATQAMFPDVVQLGDVTKWNEWDIDLGSIDLLLAGFPCQAWSMAGKQKGDSDPRGALVHDLIAIWQMINEARKCYSKEPVKFMFENVKMKKEFLDYINKLFGVEPVMINSALVSAQNRKRYYWTNIGTIEQPKDKGIVLADIIEHGVTKAESEGWHKWWYEKREFQLKKKYSAIINDNSTDKAITLTARQYASWNGNFYLLNDNKRFKAITENDRGYRPHRGDSRKTGISELGRILKEGAEKTDTVTISHQPKLATNSDTENLKYRKLTVRENARLQTVSESYIDTLLSSGISNSQLYKMLGNGWTHDVIVHILKTLIMNKSVYR